MASIDLSNIQEEEALKRIQSLYDQAFTFFPKAHIYQEQKEYHLANDMYSKGFQKLNEALNVRCDHSYCVGPKWDEARQLQQKISQLLLLNEGGFEPLFAEVHVTSDISSPSENDAWCGITVCRAYQMSRLIAASKFKVNNHELSDYVTGSACDKVAEAKNIFSISNGVILFFVSVKESFTTLSSVSSLNVYKFVDDTDEAWRRKESLPNAWLQVGTWTYPLVPEKSPALESCDRWIYYFPDIANEQDGATAVVILPHSLEEERRSTFKSILFELCAVQEESNGVLDYHSCKERDLMKLVTTAGDNLRKYAFKLKYKTGSSLQPGLKEVENSSILEVSRFLAEELRDLTIALDNKLTFHVPEQNTELLNSTLDENTDDDTLDLVNCIIETPNSVSQDYSMVCKNLRDATSIFSESVWVDPLKHEFSTASEDPSNMQIREKLQYIQSNFDQALYLFIPQGLLYQEQNELELAYNMYNKGFKKLNNALKIECDHPHCVGVEWDMARILQQQIKKMLLSSAKIFHCKTVKYDISSDLAHLFDRDAFCDIVCLTNDQNSRRKATLRSKMAGQNLNCIKIMIIIIIGMLILFIICKIFVI